MWQRLPGTREQYARQETDGSTTVISRREYDRIRQEGGEPRNIVARFAPEQEPAQVAVGRGGRRRDYEVNPPVIADVVEYEKSGIAHFYFDVTGEIAFMVDALGMDYDDLGIDPVGPAREALAAIARENPEGDYWFLRIEYVENVGSTDVPKYARKTVQTKAYGVGDDTILDIAMDLAAEYKMGGVTAAHVIVAYLDQ